MNENVILDFGILLLAAIVAGHLAHWIRLPRVTAYLIVGLLLGPHAASFLTEEHLGRFEPLGAMAMALVLFNMGCHFSLDYVRRILRRALWKSAAELLMTFTLVAGSLLLATSILPNVSLSWQAAVLLGVLALATAPATTVLVLRENESEGPVTEFAITLVALNNLAAIILFEIVFAAVLFFSQGGGESPVLTSWHLAVQLCNSVLLGALAGVAVSYACGLLSPARWLIFLVAITTLLLGACNHLEAPYLLTFLVMGTVVANASDRAPQISGELDRVTGLLCVVFFVTHGAEMNIRALLAVGTAGVIYVVARCAGKYFGVYLASGGEHDPQVKTWLGATLLSQAGAAIALTHVAGERSEPLGRELGTIVLGTVVFFEIVGPILIRRAVLAAGEVPLRKAIHHESTTVWSEARTVLHRLMLACGFDPWHATPPRDLTSGDLMRKNYDAVPANAHFEELVRVLEHSHDNVFPVVDEEGRLTGVIRYADLRDAVFDAQVAPLVRAVDLASPADYSLHPDTPLDETWRIVQASHDDLWPVVTRDSQPALVGMVARRDIYRFFLGRTNSNADH